MRKLQQHRAGQEYATCTLAVEPPDKQKLLADKDSCSYRIIVDEAQRFNTRITAAARGLDLL